MIVKDEAPIIATFLGHVKPFIDAWAIMDTGSTDPTPDIIAKELEAIPGRLGSMTWEGFESSRNAAIDLAHGLGEYLLFLDADDLPVLTNSPEALKAQLVADLHHGMISEPSGTIYPRIIFARAGSISRYRGVVHEVLIPAGGELVGANIAGFRIQRSAIGVGNRSTRGNDKFKDDAVLLEKAIAEDRDPDLQERYRFYLAQSYRDHGDIDKALENYTIRLNMPGGYHQERFISALNIGQLLAARGSSFGEILVALLQAHEIDPNRLEALFHIAVQARKHEMWNFAFENAMRVCERRAPEAGLFLDSTISEWKALFEVSLTAWYVGEFEVGFDACTELLNISSLPEVIRSHSVRNLEIYSKKVSKTVSDRSKAQPAEVPKTLSSTLAESVELISNKRYDDAITLLHSSMALLPPSAPIYYNLGVAYQFSGRLQAADSNYSTAISLNDDFVDAYYNRGLVRRDLGDLQGAIVDLQRACAIKPAWDAAKANLQKVLELSKSSESKTTTAAEPADL